MRNTILPIAATAAFLGVVSLTTGNAASIMAPVRAGLQTCVVPDGAFLRADYLPDAPTPCCGLGSHCGQLLSTVEPRAKTPKRT